MHISSGCIGRIVVGDSGWTGFRWISIVRWVLDDWLWLCWTSGWSVDSVLGVGHLALVQIRLLRSRSGLLRRITIVGRIVWSVDDLRSGVVCVRIRVGHVVLVNVCRLIGSRLAIHRKWGCTV